MVVEGTIPPKTVKTAADTASVTEAVKRFIAEHPGARVESVNGVHVRGICACGTPVTTQSVGHGYDPVTDTFTCPVCVTSNNTSL